MDCCCVFSFMGSGVGYYGVMDVFFVLNLECEVFQVISVFRCGVVCLGLVFYFVGYYMFLWKCGSFWFGFVGGGSVVVGFGVWVWIVGEGFFMWWWW